jgi:hypothetical protein
VAAPEDGGAVKLFPFLAALGLVLGAAPAAQASNIVHVRDGHVWLIDPDSGQQHQVTTEEPGFHHPSQTDDGSILASRGGLGYLLRQNGEIIRRAGGDTDETEISPDGSMIPSVGVETGCTSYCGGTGSGNIYWVTRFGAEREWTWRFSSWTGDGRALMLTNGTVGLFGPDGVPDNGETWFLPEGVPEGGDWTTAGGGKLALVTNNYGETQTLEIYRGAGPPEKPTLECYISHPSGKIEDPTWSPDGTRLAWQVPDGIEVATVTNLDDCEALDIKLLVPGGQDPHWGPAAINPGPRPVKPVPTPGPVTPRPGEGASPAPAAPRVSLDAAFRARRSTTAVRSLRLRDVPAGTRVTLRCSVRRCVRGPATVEVARPTASLDLRARLRRRSLRPGTVLDVVVTRPGETGQAWRYRVRRGKPPRRSELCVPASTTRPRPC